MLKKSLQISAKKYVLATLGVLTFYNCSVDRLTLIEEVSRGQNEDIGYGDAQTGVFTDGIVTGLEWETASLSGVTNEKGEFRYQTGETVTFKIGSIVLGKVLGQELVTPLNLVNDGAGTLEDEEVKNIAALLQTLDADLDHSNGIQLEEEIVKAIGVNFIDFSKPIETTLQDISLNVGKNAAKLIEPVFPEKAAKKMADNLGIEYVANERIYLDYFLPILKTHYAFYMPPSTVYRTTFDEAGRPIQAVATFRYSKRPVYEINFTNHNEDGLPTNATVIKLGNEANTHGYRVPKGEVPTDYWEFFYNEEGLPTQWNFAGHNVFEEYEILEINENGYPTKTISTRENQFNNFSTTEIMENTFSKGFLVQQHRLENLIAKDCKGTITGNSVMEVTLNFDYTLRWNFESILADLEVTSKFYYNDQEDVSIFTLDIDREFAYYPNLTLKKITETNQEEAVGYSSLTRTEIDFDEQDLIIEYSRDFGNGSLLIANYENGVEVSSRQTLNGLPYQEQECLENGNLRWISYNYDQEGVLLTKNISESMNLSPEITVQLYGEIRDGEDNLIERYETDYHDDGREREYRKYNENNTLILKVLYIYNAEDLLQTKEFYDGEGKLTSKRYYDDCILLGEEYFSRPNNSLRRTMEKERTALPMQNSSFIKHYQNKSLLLYP